MSPRRFRLILASLLGSSALLSALLLVAGLLGGFGERRPMLDSSSFGSFSERILERLQRAGLLADDAFLGAAEEPPSDPAPVPVAGATPVAVNRIAYVDPGGRIFSVAPDGSQRRQLGFDQGRFDLPTWSPDGRQIAAVGAQPRTAGLWVGDAGPGGDGQLSALQRDRSAPPFYLYWAPDGRGIGYLAQQEEALGLRYMGLEADAPRLLASGAPLYWDWAQEGRQALAHVGDEGLRLLPVAPLADETERRSLAEPGRFRAPGVSADGRLLAFGERFGRDRNRLVIRAPASAEDADRPFTVPHRGVAALSWSPTAERLAFISPPYELPVYIGPLRLAEVEERGVRDLVNAPVMAFFWSPDGQRIAYFTLDAQGSPDSIQARLPFPARLQRPAPEAWAQSPPRRPGLKLWVIDVDGAAPPDEPLAVFRPSRDFAMRVLPFFDQFAMSHRLWSPDGRSLVLPMEDEQGLPRIVVVDLAEGNQRQIGRGTLAFWSWH